MWPAPCTQLFLLRKKRARGRGGPDILPPRGEIHVPFEGFRRAKESRKEGMGCNPAPLADPFRDIRSRPIRRVLVRPHHVVGIQPRKSTGEPSREFPLDPSGPCRFRGERVQAVPRGRPDRGDREHLLFHRVLPPRDDPGVGHPSGRRGSGHFLRTASTATAWTPPTPRAGCRETRIATTTPTRRTPRSAPSATSGNRTPGIIRQWPLPREATRAASTTPSATVKLRCPTSWARPCSIPPSGEQTSTA